MAESKMTQHFHAAGSKRYFYTVACLHFWKQKNAGVFAPFFFFFPVSFVHERKATFSIVLPNDLFDIKPFFFPD